MASRRIYWDIGELHFLVWGGDMGLWFVGGVLESDIVKLDVHGVHVYWPDRYRGLQYFGRTSGRRA